ncbi:sigma-E processing peptidase SpoIIGA [Senegalia massiliensis]|uniref:Sporulation sigma-E factor-processing peptidase n=1 Tax=Senegalia massiliensis TaxID=1720316 RepID=A0A845QY76_9CLOT|nr:sigma-E processing peptidase SpoIIGA [Senegalia massiliensis]NBI06749.1 sigma-E processing peptidase SpoIIGA [Senegalia massiliensis]
MYIYAEYLLIENFIINYIILYVTKRFTRTDTNNIRIILSALLGALYTLIVFIPKLHFMGNFIGKICISIILIILAFNPFKLKKFLKLFATFYTVSFVFAGGSFALFYLTNSKVYFGEGIFYIKSINNFKPSILIVGIIISYIFYKIASQYIYSKISKENMYVSFIVKLQDKTARLKGLVDTGNSLIDPITNIPVIVVEFSAISELLPSSIRDIFTIYSEDDLSIISRVISNSNELIKFRLIPFKSVGKENGMLLGFKPDRIIIENDEDKQVSEIVIGIYNSHLTNNNDYVALLHPEIIN